MQTFMFQSQQRHTLAGIMLFALTEIEKIIDEPDTSFNRKWRPARMASVNKCLYTVACNIKYNEHLQ